ncbi:hypothetical protein KAJ02_01190 [Candidatus Bipolaricaulota bacterium]|nr:hypothetical protein [Candidatus Bipolaricaulota bacterium]
MKRAIVLGLLIGLMAWSSIPGMSSGVGLSAGFDPTGLWLIGALTELSITEIFDLRAQIGFAIQEIEGLMLASVSVLPHWSVPPIDPFVGIGVGIALTPPTFSTGLIVEGVAGVRLVPADVVSIVLQARYLLRWTEGNWTSGPIFEGAILINF